METNDKNYDEILLAMINEDNAELIIQTITDYLSQPESS
jgi:hypothetical protein